MLGTTHNSVIIEMRDYLVVVEAPLYEERDRRRSSKPSRSVFPASRYATSFKPIIISTTPAAYEVTWRKEPS